MFFSYKVLLETIIIIIIDTADDIGITKFKLTRMQLIVYHLLESLTFSLTFSIKTDLPSPDLY